MKTSSKNGSLTGPTVLCERQTGWKSSLPRFNVICRINRNGKSVGHLGIQNAALKLAARFNWARLARAVRTVKSQRYFQESLRSGTLDFGNSHQIFLSSPIRWLDGEHLLKLPSGVIEFR
jgi:hypothetical protein